MDSSGYRSVIEAYDFHSRSKTDMSHYAATKAYVIEGNLAAIKRARSGRRRSRAETAGGAAVDGGTCGLPTFERQTDTTASIAGSSTGKRLSRKFWADWK